MTDIDKIARELAEDISFECGCSMPSVNAWVVTDWIRESLQSYGDECARQMRGDAALFIEMNKDPRTIVVLSEESGWKPEYEVATKRYAEAIRALPLPFEKVKP